MIEWMILTATHLLKTALLGTLALVSWSVDLVTTPWVETYGANGPHAVFCCRAEVESEAVLADLVAEKAAKVSKVAWIRLGQRVPPIRIEALYTPDVLRPVLVNVPKPPANPAT